MAEVHINTSSADKYALHSHKLFRWQTKYIVLLIYIAHNSRKDMNIWTLLMSAMYNDTADGEENFCETFKVFHNFHCGDWIKSVWVSVNTRLEWITHTGTCTGTCVCHCECSLILTYETPKHKHKNCRQSHTHFQQPEKNHLLIKYTRKIITEATRG